MNLNLVNLQSLRESNQLKGVKKKEKKNYNIEGIIDCIRINYCDVNIEKKSDKNIKIEDRIEVQFDWIIKAK